MTTEQIRRLVAAPVGTKHHWKQAHDHSWTLVLDDGKAETHIGEDGVIIVFPKFKPYDMYAVQPWVTLP